jgi:hypothetical protein
VLTSIGSRTDRMNRCGAEAARSSLLLKRYYAPPLRLLST